jgi:hypothetical protein
MNELLSQLNNFISPIGCLISQIEENIKAITIVKKQCMEEQGSVITSFDFENLFKIYDDSLSIRIFNEKKNYYNYIKKGYDKQLTEEYIEDTIEAYDNFDLEITINKDKLLDRLSNNVTALKNYNCNIFFSVANLINYLNDYTIQRLEQQLFSKEKNNIFLIINENVQLDNGLTLIIGGKSLFEIDDYIKNKFQTEPIDNNLKKIIEMRNEMCHWVNGTEWICPEYIYFNFDDNCQIFTEDLKRLFLKKSTNLIIPFIADYSEKDEVTNELLCNINGYKKIKVIINDCNSYDSKQVKYLFKLYKWVYADSNTDRICILRNIITIFLCGECVDSFYMQLLDKSYEIYKSVQNNFEIYLRGNVKEYFEERHKVREMITNKSKDITNEIGSIIETMSKNFLTSVGVLIAAIVGYIAKADLVIIRVSLFVYGLFILLNAVYSLPFYYIRVKGIIADYDEHIDTFRKTLIKEDIPDGKIINKNIISFYIYWIGSIIITIAIIVGSIISLIFTEKIIETLKKVLS